MYKRNFIKPDRLSQGKNELLEYFHRLHKARLYADVLGTKRLKEEAKRVKEKALFCKSWGATHELAT